MKSDVEVEDRRGYLVWEWLSRDLSHNAVRWHDMNLDQTLEVGQVYRFMRENGLHRYMFHGGGSGCRFWV